MEIIRPEQIIGKPLVVYIDGERIEIGSITRAALKDGSLFFAASLRKGDDEVQE